MLVDPDGKEAIVFVVAGGNPLTDMWTAQGHAAVYVKRDGRGAGVSEGTPVGFENGIRGFLSQYAKQGREVRMYVLNVPGTVLHICALSTPIIKGISSPRPGLTDGGDHRFGFDTFTGADGYQAQDGVIAI